MKFKHISTKFIISYVSILTVIFSVLIAVFHVGYRVSLNGYIRKNSYLMQEELDAAVTDVVNESAYLYGRMMVGSNIGLLRGIADEECSPAQRKSDFDTLMIRAGVDREYFNDVVISVNNARFSVRENPVEPVSDYAQLSANPNKLAYIGNAAGCLVMGIFSNGIVADFEGIVLFYLCENKISEMCNPVSGEEGYSFIMRSDGYIVSHINADLVGKVIVYSDVYNPETAPAYKTETLDGVKRIVVTSRPELLNSRYGFESCIVSVLDYKYYFG